MHDCDTQKLSKGDQIATAVGKPSMRAAQSQ